MPNSPFDPKPAGTWMQQAVRHARWLRPLHFAIIVLGSALLSWMAWIVGQPAWSGLDRLAWDSAFHARGPLLPQAVAALPQTRDILCVQASHAIPRALLARLVRNMSQARAVALDFMLVDSQADLAPAEKSLYASDIRRWKKDDALLASAIKSNGRVLLALWPEDARPAVAPPVIPVLSGQATAASMKASQGAAQGRERGSNFEWRSPAPQLVKAAHGLGHVVIEEEDGVQRRVKLWQPTRHKPVPCLGLALAALASRQSPEQFAKGKNWKSEGGSAVVDWLGGPETFGQLENSVNYEVALGWSPQDFKNRIVIVGEVSRQSKEIVLTPWGEAPAMQAHANVAAMLLAPQGPPATLPSTWTLVLCLVGAAQVVSGLWKLGLWGSGACLLIQGALAFPACAWMLSAHHWLIPISAPLAASFLAFNALALYEYKRTRRALSRFIGADVIARVLHPLSTLEPGESGGREEEATAFFCDLRGYSTLAELLPTRQTVILVNAYTTLLLRVMTRWGGRVIDYQGDGMFVLFEALPDRAARALGIWSEGPEEATRLAGRHATRASHAALEVVRGMAQFNALWEPIVGHKMAVGVGLQSGLMEIGIIGSHDRVHFGAIGDSVNVAARVQEFSKTLPARVIIAHGAQQAIEREGSMPGFKSGALGIEIEDFGLRPIRGRKQEVRLWGLRQITDAASSTSS